MSPAIGMVGLGEAGSAIAIDLLAAGATVRGWDPVAAMPKGVEPANDAAGAASGTDVVISANSSWCPPATSAVTVIIERLRRSSPGRVQISPHA